MQHERSSSVIGYSVWFVCSLILFGFGRYLLLFEAPLPPALISNWLLPHSILAVISYSAIIAGLIVSIISSFKTRNIPNLVLYLQICATATFFACVISGSIWAISAWGGEDYVKLVLSFVLLLVMIACSILLTIRRDTVSALAVLSIELAFSICSIFSELVLRKLHMYLFPSPMAVTVDGRVYNVSGRMYEAAYVLQQQGILGWTLLGLLILTVLIGLIPAFIMKQKGYSRFISWWIYGAALPVVAIPHAILMKSEHSSPQIKAIVYCTQCGTKISETAKFCTGCGSSL